MPRGCGNFQKFRDAFKGKDDFDIPPFVASKQAEIGKELHKRKVVYNPILKRGYVFNPCRATYIIGPFDLPLDVFVSSRWHERRSKMPLAKDRPSWFFAWLRWNGAKSYKCIKEHIEKHGMLKPIEAEWFVNYDPNCGRLIHNSMSFRCKNLEWPFLMLRRGNERLLMAWFEWGWKSIPTNVWIRDCGWSKEFSEILNWFCRFLIPKEHVGTKRINRRVEDKGVSVGDPYA